MARSPITHREKANSKRTGTNAVGQNVTTVMNKTLQNTRNLKKNYVEESIYLWPHLNKLLKKHYWCLKRTWIYFFVL